MIFSEMLVGVASLPLSFPLSETGILLHKCSNVKLWSLIFLFLDRVIQQLGFLILPIFEKEIGDFKMFRVRNWLVSFSLFCNFPNLHQNLIVSKNKGLNLLLAKEVHVPFFAINGHEPLYCWIKNSLRNPWFDYFWQFLSPVCNIMATSISQSKRKSGLTSVLKPFNNQLFLKILHPLKTLKTN